MLINKQENLTYWLEHSLTFSFSVMESRKSRGKNKKGVTKALAEGWEKKNNNKWKKKKAFLSNISFVRSEA